MNILLLNWRDRTNPRAGGAEVVTEEVASRLARKGHHITLFTSRFPKSTAQETRAGYTIVRHGNEWTVHMWALIYWFKKLRHEQFDVVIDQIHGIPFFTPLYMRTTRKVVFIHEVAREIWLTMYPWPINYIGYFLEPRILRLYKKVPFITVSQSTKDDLIAAGISSAMISLVSEAITLTPFLTLPSKEDNPTLIFVGRLAPMKRVEDIIKAFQIVQQHISRLTLWVVGHHSDAAYANQLKKLASNDQSIVFHGFVSEDQKQKLLSRAWLLLNTSLKEGFGLNVIEAAACGTPAVTYNVPGLREAVRDRETGLLTGENTPENLASQITALIQDQNRYRIMQQNALDYSRQFTFDRTAEEFEKIISATL
ncbi:MAG: glycosyltransferase family 4 protein [Candidatus Andersenbacteria bacterium]